MVDKGKGQNRVKEKVKEIAGLLGRIKNNVDNSGYEVQLRKKINLQYK